MIYCSLCVLEFNHENVYNLHLESKNHLNALRFQEEAKTGSYRKPFYCSLCSLFTDTSAMLDVHLQSERHQVKFILQQKYEKTNSKVLKIRESMFRSLSSSQTCPDFKKNVSELNVNSKTSPEIKKSVPKPDLSDDLNWNSEWCHLCFCKYTSEPHKESHLKGFSVFHLFLFVFHSNL